VPPPLLVAVLAGLTYVGVAVGRIPGLRTNRATIAFVGATALVLVGALPLDRAFRAIDLHTLALLFGMMVLNANLRLAGFFGWAAGFTLRVARGPKSLLALLLATSGVLSALFLNDTICLMLTPLVVDVAARLRRDPVPYLIGLMVATNIGSVATVTGNPQNMFIAIRSGIGYLSFACALAPVAAGGLASAWAVLVAVFPREFRAGDWPAAPPAVPAPVERHLLVKSLGVTALLLALLLIGLPFALAALVAAALLLLTRRMEPARVFAELDWHLLVFFASLFVVTAALGQSGLTDAVTARLHDGLGHALAGEMLVTATLANLVSNVPAVLLMTPLAEAAHDPHGAFLALAASSTLSGNLTLLGSIANLIVLEIARGRGVRVGFLTHLRVGVPLTLLTLALAWLWLR